MNDQSSIIYGYARVSTAEQNLDRQLIALKAAGVAEVNIYADKKSGKDFNRPAWKRLFRKLRAGDLLIVTSIDRFGRNYDEIIAVWGVLTNKKKVHLRVLDSPLLDTTTAHGLLSVFIANLVLQVLSFVAETERQHIKTRQREGINAAKARGVVFGRPRITPPPQFDAIRRLYDGGTMSLSAAATACGMSYTTFWRYTRKGPLMSQELRTSSFKS